MPDNDTPYGGYFGSPDPVLVLAAILISVVVSIWQYSHILDSTNVKILQFRTLKSI